MSFRSRVALRLIGRYIVVLRDAWSLRSQFSTIDRRRDEAAFLPAHLELMEAPIHPLPKWSLRVIIAGVCAVVLISVFGRLDIVVVGDGKLVPTNQVKIIQPAITGVVRQITVRDGQRVVAGEVLVELDTRQAAADADKARSLKVAAELAIARAQALLEAQKSDSTPVIRSVANATEVQLLEARRFAEGIFREYSDKLAAVRADRKKRAAELETTLAEVAKLRATAPLVRQEANNYKNLAADRYVSQHDYLDKERTALEQEHDLLAQLSHAQELAAAVTEQDAVIASTISQFRREQLDALDKASEENRQDLDDELKADTRKGLLTLCAPVAGTVQQLSVHTLGGVVTTGQALMEIVPDDAVEVEAFIQNKDIGFLQVGQSVVVKVMAFPYTRYGYLTGSIVSVANDSLRSTNKKIGSSFIARIKLNSTRMHTDGGWTNLTPGMEVKAEVRTGRRSVLDYFLEPILNTATGSLRER